MGEGKTVYRLETQTRLDPSVPTVPTPQGESPTFPNTPESPWAADPPGILLSLPLLLRSSGSPIQLGLGMADAFHFPLGLSLHKAAGDGLCLGQRGTDSVAWRSPSHFMVATLQTWRGRWVVLKNRFLWGGERCKFLPIFSPVYFEILVVDCLQKNNNQTKQKKIPFLGYFCLTPAIFSRGLGLLKEF